MSKKPNPEMIDRDNPEWTPDDFKKAVPFSKLPAEMQAKLAAVRRTRGPNKAPTKERITIRLSPEVVDSFRASGDGWQGRIDTALKDWLKTHSPA